ncbi:helix-turn-helix transcriptional regulator [Staphylococcus epidermidis]|nr:helix-turn-helix transcriptional regulator [Staphylococcus epidermidis]
MNVSNQIKKFRERDGYSQEFLAEKMFVSRQTISNWENDKSYPDIHNLLIMCQLFKISPDELVEDDLKNGQIKSIKKELDFWTWMMIIPIVLGSVLIGPMTHYFYWLGMGITYLVFLIGIIASTKLEKIKIKNDIETYDKILAFINGKDPKEVQKSKFRDIWTSSISFIFFVGVIIGISYLSIILTDYFL